MSNDRYVFVYGTLRRGQTNDIHRYEPEPQFVADAVIAGQLYHLGGYPGARLDGEGWVHGEVYAISSALEAQLDVLEEVSPVPTGEYTRQMRVVHVQGRDLTCLVYEIAIDRVRAAPQLLHGDWLRRDEMED